MSYALPIDGSDFERWADRPEARFELPILVRRLLWASTRLQELSMPGGSGVDHRGYDGFCRSEDGSAFCPVGGSVWEISVNQRVTQKLARDLAKRGEALLPQVEQLSFVFVTPRRVAMSATERHAPPAPWRSVRVIDADGLAQWIEQCPAVLAWFSRRHLQRPVEDLTTLDAYLARWSAATRPPLPPRLILLGRSSQAAQVPAWLAERPGALTVQATTKDEARIFLAAALDALPAAMHEQWSARTIFVETPAAWRWLLKASTTPLLLIPGFDDFDPRLAHGPHFMGLPGDRENLLPAESQLTLDEPLPWRDVEKLLREAGLEPWRAERIARETRGQLRPLQRSLGLRELPRWAEREEHGELVAALLLGAWCPDVEADAAAVRTLGADPIALDRLCTRLRIAPEAPMRNREGTYSWAAPDDAWRSLVGLVSDAVLRNFLALAVDVLGEDDPRERLPKDERPVVAIWGGGFRHSGALRGGVAESLRYLARHNNHLRRYIGVSVGRNLAERVVEQVMTTSWIRWSALEPYLQSLAEAAPNRFLARLSDSLIDPEGVVRLFDVETESTIYRRRPHVALLWALEALAWNPANMPMVAELLAVLTARDPARREADQHRRVSNRPQASLEAIFHISNPQTLADDEARFAVLAALAGRHPDVAFALLLQVFKQRAGGRLPQTRRPSDGESLAGSQLQDPTLDQINARSLRVLDLLLELADRDATLWAALIEADIDRLLDDGHSEEFVNRLLARRDGFGDMGVAVWQAARELLARLYSVDYGNPFEKRIARLRQIYEAFTPGNLLARVSWLFEGGEILPEPHSITLEDSTRRLDAMRATALEEILARDDADDLIVQLIGRLEDLDKLGRALSRCSAAASLQERLLHQQQPPEPWARIVASFACGCFYTAQREFGWLRALVLKWRDEQRVDDIVETLHKIWAEPKVWDIVDNLGEPLRTSYWSGLKLVGEHEEHQWARACEHLLAAGNVSTAFELAAYRCGELDTAMLVQVLEHFSAAPDATIRGATYRAERIFLEFDRRDEQGIDEVTRGRIVALEFRLIPLLEHSYRRRPRFVWQVLSDSPEFYVECLRAMYHGDNGADEDVDENRTRISELAYRIVDAWRDFPGSESDDARAWEPKLLDWAERVFALARESHRLVVAQFRVAEVLARPQAGEDGHWPCLAARKLLQRGEFPELTKAMHTAKYNLRGVTSHGLHEGGAQERGLAAKFQASADALRTQWPQVGMLLDELVSTYKAEGERQDEWAREQRIEAGVGPKELPQAKPLAGNPFLASRPLDGPDLPGRAHILRELEELLAQRSPALVKAPRRGGKTSVLHALATRLGGGRRVVHRLSLEGRALHGPDEFARLLDPSLADIPRAAEALRQQLAAGSADPPAILIDEIAWLRNSDVQLFAWLRMLSQEGLAWLVLAGSHGDWVDVIKAASRMPGSSFGNDFTVIELSPLTEDDAVRFLVDTAPPDVPLVPSNTVRWILECCGTWPFYLQVMGYAVVEEVRAGHRETLVDRRALVELYERRLLGERLAVFRSRWSDLRRPAQEVLLAELELARTAGQSELTQYGDLSRPARTVLSDADLIDAVRGWKIDRPFHDWLYRNLDELELSDA